MVNTKRRGTTGKTVLSRSGHYRSAMTGRFVTTDAETITAPKTAGKSKQVKPVAASVVGLTYKGCYGTGQPRVAIKAVTRIRPAYTRADEEQVVRLAKAAEQARTDPGENLSGLSREEFLARLLG